MLRNPFRNDEAHQSAAIAVPMQDHAQGAGGAPHAAAASADELQLWQDRIATARSDDAALLLLAHQAPSVDLKLIALNALTREDSLKQAMREFRDHDKRLLRTARTRWQAASNQRIAVAEARALIANARALLEQESVPANRIVELDRAWAGLDSGLLDAELPAEFAALREQLAARARARGVGEQAITRWLAAADDMIAQLSASLPGVALGESPPGEASARAASLLELVGMVPDALDARCTGKTDSANRALALASSVVQRAEFLSLLPPASGAVDEAEEKLKIGQWREFPDVAHAELQAVLARRFADWRNAGSDERQREHDARRVQEQEAGAAQKKLRLSAIQHDIEAAESAQAAGSSAELTRLMALIERALKAGPVNAALARRIETLRVEQKRLRDWQRWSGKQGREQLVTEAQALAAAAAAGKVAVKSHAEAIDKLRDRWKELDKLGGATNQSLWLAFDGALKAAYAPVAAHLDKIKAARSENLAAREKLVEALVLASAKLLPVAQEGAASTPDAVPDMRALARAVEDAQVAWRKLGPVEHTVPRKAQKGDNAITTRYAQAVQALEAPLAEAYREATREREQLISAAKSLGAEATARDVLDKVRALQSRWQANARALTLPRRDESRLWAEFKTATDAIFTARDAARTARETEFSAKIKLREEIIERLSALAPDSGGPEIKRAMAEADTAWRAAAEVPKPLAVKLDARFRAARDAVSRQLASLATRAAQARYDALIAKMDLCRERELAIDAGTEIVAENAADLESRWNSIDDLPDAWKAPLERRFRGENSVPSGSRSGAKSGDALPDILLNLEVACGLDSPAEFLADRQSLKLRALKSAMEGRQATVTTPADIERWLLAAAAAPRPDDGSRDRLARIIAALRVRR